MARSGGLVQKARAALHDWDRLRAQSRAAGEGLDRLGLMRMNGAETAAQAVREAVLDAPDDAPVPPEMLGPLEVVAVMAAPVLARRWRVEVTEENLQLIVQCLVETWTQELALSEREHFEAWRESRGA